MMIFRAAPQGQGHPVKVLHPEPGGLEHSHKRGEVPGLVPEDFGRVLHPELDLSATGTQSPPAGVQGVDIGFQGQHPRPFAEIAVNLVSLGSEFRIQPADIGPQAVRRPGKGYF